jgi:hypothetical protein
VTSPTLPPPRERPAASAADRNYASNLAATEAIQPAVAAEVGSRRPEFRPVLARDGSLTAFDAAGKWWRGCSVPLRAAEAMLASLDVKGRVACLLLPTLAAHVRVALNRSRPDQAIVALCEDADDLAVMLRCDDFSADIRAGRLWLATGAVGLRQLFDQQPGLATPAQFIRLPTTAAEDVDAAVAAAQGAFAEVNALRSRAVVRRRDAWHRREARPPRLCVVAPSHFRLWDDAGAVLAEALRGDGPATVAAFDPDDPRCSSGLALQDAALQSDAVAAADTSRADLPGVVPAALPWITWVTRPGSIPLFPSVAPTDGLVVADPKWSHAAYAAGWPADRVGVGAWPRSTAAIPNPPRVLAVVADTRPVVMPEQLEEFSSHQLLWERIAAELASDPFALREGPAAYLERRMQRHGVAADGFDAAAFLARLILPAYAQALVRVLVHERLPVRLLGAGWTELDEFRAQAAGPVVSRSDLSRIRDESAAFVQVWPTMDMHPIERLGRPVVNAGGSGRSLIEAARSALTGNVTPPPTGNPVSLQQFLSLLPG